MTDEAFASKRSVGTLDGASNSQLKEVGKEKIGLQKTVGLASAISIIIGTMIG
jgi:hypothetical protein